MSSSKDEKSRHQTLNKAYRKPEFLDDSYDHLAKHSSGDSTRQASQLDDEDFLPDFFAKDAPTFTRNEVNINLPWLIAGAPWNDLKTRFMGE